jgi:organic radical activating enzyme
MEIIEIQQRDWDSDLFWIELEISNICNYKCHYCFTDYNTGTIKWPDYELLVNNLSYLIEYYLKNTKKKKIALHLLGGEVTHWKRFKDFVKHFKEKYNVIIVLTTNGSKKIEWWNGVYHYLDSVHISVHREYADYTHISKVADFLHINDVDVEANVFMDPFEWDKCEELLEGLKTSDQHWPIARREIIMPNQPYTDEQKMMLHEIVRCSDKPIKFVISSLSNDCITTVIDSDGKEHSMRYKEILFNRANRFKGWDCDLGIDWICVHANGTLSGVCRNRLYNSDIVYNIFDFDFDKKFKPNITSTTCHIDYCWCILEANMPKRKIGNSTTNKVISIYAD